MSSEICLGARFASFPEVTQALKEYSTLNHVEFCIRDSVNLNNVRVARDTRRANIANLELKYYRVHYVCVFGGVQKSRKNVRNIRKTKSKFKGCGVSIQFTLSRCAQFLEITDCKLEHNHVRSEDELNRLSRRRRLTLEQKRRAIRLLQTLPNKRMAQQVLMQETGKVILLKDLTNVLSQFKRSEFTLQDDPKDSLQLNEESNVLEGMEAFVEQEPQSEGNIAYSGDPIEWNNTSSEYMVLQEQNSSPPQPVLPSSFVHCNYSGENNELQINEAILNMIIKDLQPLSIVEDQGFLDLMQVLAPLYKVPSRKRLSNMLSCKYDNMVVLFKENFSTVEHISIACDVWTDITGEKLIGITALFCDEFELKAANLGLYLLNHPYDHLYIALKLNEMCCGEWAINHNKIVSVVSDKDENIVKGIQHCFGDQKHLYCFARALVLVPSKSIAATTSLTILLRDIKNIISFLEQSEIATDMLQKAQEEAGISEENILRLNLDISMHWDSSYCLLQNFLKLSGIIDFVLMKIPFAPMMLTPGNLCAAKEVFKLLKVLNQSTIEFSRENYITCSKVIPVVKTLINKVETVQPTSKTGISFKHNIQKEILKCFQNVEEIEILAIATVMDPRFKKLHFQDSSAVATVTNKILKLLSDSNTSSSEYELVQNVRETESDEEDFWSFHKKKSSHTATKENLGVLHELTTYLDQPVIPITSNPYKYWDAMQNVFPNIYKLAIKYLSVTASSVPAERLFTKSSAIITAKRNRLSLEHLNKVLFLSSNGT